MSDTSYNRFAYIYDVFMSDEPYDTWADRINGLISKYTPDCQSILDLGCGTGVMTRLLRDRGYNMTGLDLSPDMLAVAASYDDDILYINQDMCELELPYTFDCMISAYDSINYLTASEDILSCFQRVFEYLEPGGLFIFDFHNVGYYAAIGESVIAENRDAGSFIWENYYDPDTHINEYDLTLYILDEDGRYTRSEETHVQRGYSLEEMTEALLDAGFEILEYSDTDTDSEPDENTGRIRITTRKA